jgi:hypothetical protein
VAQSCNSSYSGGRDREGWGSKPAWANSSYDPISKNPSQKRASGVAQGVGPEFKPQYWEKKIAGRWWLTPIVLATQEKEIRNIQVRSQPGQIDRETLSRKTQHKTRPMEWLK